MKFPQIFSKKQGRPKKYHRQVFCKKCAYYVGRRAGKYGMYCTKQQRHVSPYGYCPEFEIFEKRVWKNKRQLMAT